MPSVDSIPCLFYQFIKRSDAAAADPADAVEATERLSEFEWLFGIEDERKVGQKQIDDLSVKK